MFTDKNIVQIHQSYDALGIYERVCVERWKWMNPDWDYRFITNEEGDEVVKKVLGDRFSRFENFHFGARNNIRRACVVYQYGGLFSDCDLYPVKPLSEYFPEDRERVLFRYDGGRNLFLNGLFACPAGDRMLLDIVNLSFDYLTDPNNPAPSTDSKDWDGWHFDVCGVHCWNDVMLKYEKVEDGVEGGDSHPKYTDFVSVDQIKCLHYGTHCWSPNRKHRPENEENRMQLKALEMAKQTWGI